MDKGKIESFGAPIDLLNNEKTILHDLVYSLDKTEKNKLIEIAQKSSMGKNTSNAVKTQHDENSEISVDITLSEANDYDVAINDEKQAFLKIDT